MSYYEVNEVATLTIQLSDAKHNRLKVLAQHRHMSVNKLIDELSTEALAEFDSEACFRALSAGGDPAGGLVLLDKLDAHFSES